ncbi:hypothetical protein [Rickettsiella massiliensis]|uniref:hypothetical protein n=1 Tax=Rickettsiella massiliensis TaxID=676517 RepID=UPI0002D870DD|nr:hypothetical protein [Rickettsiella massiliensis]
MPFFPNVQKIVQSETVVPVRFKDLSAEEQSIIERAYKAYYEVTEGKGFGVRMSTARRRR